MTALYNEIDKNAAAWLRQLIIAGLIAPGVVDERDIRDLEPEYVASFTQFHAFAGIGVWSHALRGAGWSDDRPIWTGSCPCQPFSAAGKGGGFDDERHLWPAFHHLIEQCRPDVVLGEQVASKDGLGWLDLVHADLEGAGYAVGAVDTCAAGFGAPHIRQRLWWVGSREGVEHAASDGRIERRAESSGRGLAGGRVALELAHTLDPLGRADLPAGNDTARPDAGRAEGAGDAGAGRGLCGVADAQGDGHERCGQFDQSAGRNGAAHGGADGGWLADSDGSGLRGESVLRLQRPDLHDADGCGQLLGLADANGGNACPEGVQRGGQHGLVAEDARTGLMGLPLAPAGRPHPIPAPERSPHLANRLDDHDSDGARQAVGGVHLGCSQPDGGVLRPGPTNGIWGAADWLHCRDGRWRPVEPGTFPLAHGAAARVGRLRGYGNAIVAPQAQAFVEAVMEAVS